MKKTVYLAIVLFVDGIRAILNWFLIEENRTMNSIFSPALPNHREECDRENI